MVTDSPWIVIPTYNERETIKDMIAALFELNIENLSVLIVDDSSPDGTASIVRQLQRIHPSLHLEVRDIKNGLGKAYIHGFHYALMNGATAIVQMDADFSHDPIDVPRLLKLLNKNDLVIGSRYLRTSKIVNWPWQRLVLSIAANKYVGIVTWMPIKDATGGFKAWRAATLKAVDVETVKADGYGFQIVMNYRAWKKGKQIQETPVIFTERRAGQSKMSKAIIWEALWVVWKLRWTDKELENNRGYFPLENKQKEV
jgi:dolichol-phosphate mannosyltransferase